MTKDSKSTEVLKAIHGVTDDLSRIGLGKDRRNPQQGYMYRGIDDLMDLLSPLLVKHYLLILPSIIDRELRIGETQRGGQLFHTILRVRYRLVCIVDGSEIELESMGEAFDTFDKSLGKALSYAWKQLMIQLFCIPINGQEADIEAKDIESFKGEEITEPKQEMNEAKVPNEPVTPKTLAQLFTVMDDVKANETKVRAHIARVWSSVREETLAEKGFVILTQAQAVECINWLEGFRSKPRS